MKNWVKILLPIIGIAYCIAFLEINFHGDAHQTWNDPYDTYLVTQNNNEAHPANQSVDSTSPNFALSGVVSIDLVIFILFSFLLIPYFVLPVNFSGLYLKNCNLLI